MYSKLRLLPLLLTIVTFLFATSISFAQVNSTAEYTTADHEKQVIAYITQWDAWKGASAGLDAQGVLNQLNIDYTQYTMLNWSFFGVANDGSLHSGDLRNQQIYHPGAVQEPGEMFMSDIYSSWDLWLFNGCLEILWYLPDNLCDQPTHSTYWAYELYGYKGSGSGWINVNTGETGPYPLSLHEPRCQYDGLHRWVEHV